MELRKIKKVNKKKIEGGNAERMNRKGIGVQYIIGGVLALFVLFFVVFGGVGEVDGLLDRLLNIFPTFGTSNEPIEGVSILRYDIVDDNVQYFTGKEWVDFEKKGNVRLGDRLFFFDNLKLSFSDNFFFSRNLRGDNKGILQEGGQRMTIAAYMQVQDNDIPKPKAFYSRGDVIVDLRAEDKSLLKEDLNFVEGRYRVTLDGKINVQPFKDGGGYEDQETIKQFKGYHSALVNEAVGWRDSVFKTFVPIAYVGVDTEEITPLRLCVEEISGKRIIDGRYLIVDLEKDVGVGGSC